MSTYSKILLATDAADSYEEKAAVYDAAMEWADPDAEFSILSTVTTVADKGAEKVLPSISQLQQDILDDAEREILNLAKDSGIEGKARILARRLEDAIQDAPADDDTLAIVNNEHNNADITELKCDTLFVRS